ncbi:MAG: hypothetical protein K2X64_07775, partial [Rhodocyclaceae bacterium]|nr:hypothetical protein [Rhodocyclaceae bacterium]
LWCKSKNINTDWLDEVPLSMPQAAPASETATPATAPALPQTAEVLPTIRHKLRRNFLDAAIEEAILKAGSLDTAAVFLHLREMALNSKIPFTGLIEGAALLYTREDQKIGRLNKPNLGKRLKRRKP